MRHDTIDSSAANGSPLDSRPQVEVARIHERASAPVSTTRPQRSSTGPSENIPYLLGVDHLRGVAALLVLYYHGIYIFQSQTRYGAPFDSAQRIMAPEPFSALLLEGHTAISLFMVLSGFVFAFGAAGKRVAYRQFLINRFLRTYPLFLFMVIVGSAVHRRSFSLLSLLQTVLGGANLEGHLDLGTFSAVFWTVSVEWQLYLLFPALMLLLNRVGPVPLARLIALVVGARVLGYMQGLDVTDGVFNQVIGRLDQFMIGMLAGWFYSRNRSLGSLRHLVALAPGLILVDAFLVNRLGGLHADHWLKVLTPTLEGAVWAGGVLGYVALTEQRRSGPGLVSKALSAVGACSYSIYLWHFVFVDVQRKHAWVPQWISDHTLNAFLVVTLTTLPVVLAFSALSYNALEKPFMLMRKRYLGLDQRAVDPAASPNGMHDEKTPASEPGWLHAAPGPR
jgi:peptidoglycan/LPS O-acetylase OafA/YrhL